MKPDQNRRYETPKNCDDLVDLLMADLMADHLDVLGRMSAEEFELFYTAVASHIIEEFDLWTGNHRLLSSCLLSDTVSDGTTDPARVILNRLRNRIREAAGTVIIT